MKGCKTSDSEIAKTDNLGSCRSVISVKGVDMEVQSIDYKPFGDTLNSSTESRIGYIGKERDKENSYFAMGIRQYDCETGRFLSIDPLFEKFREQSPYQYAFNNPLTFKDPTGLEPESEKGGEDRMLMDEVNIALLGFNLLTNELRNSYLNFRLSFLTWLCAVYNLEMRFEIAGGEIYGLIGSGGPSGGGGGSSGARTGSASGSMPYNKNGIKGTVNYNYDPEKQKKEEVESSITSWLDWMSGSEEGYSRLSQYFKKGYDLNFDVSFNGTDLAKKFNESCGTDYSFMAGFTYTTWSDCDASGYSNVCSSNSFDIFTIYIAMDYLYSNYENDIFYFYYNNIPQLYNGAGVFTHEFGHLFDSYFVNFSIFREKSANSYFNIVFNEIAKRKR